MENPDLVPSTNVLQHAIKVSKKLAGQETGKPNSTEGIAINHLDLNRIYTSMVSKSEKLTTSRRKPIHVEDRKTD